MGALDAEGSSKILAFPPFQKTYDSSRQREHSREDDRGFLQVLIETSKLMLSAVVGRCVRMRLPSWIQMHVQISKMDEGRQRFPYLLLRVSASPLVHRVRNVRLEALTIGICGCPGL